MQEEADRLKAEEEKILKYLLAERVHHNAMLTKKNKLWKDGWSTEKVCGYEADLHKLER